jgi:hypothetical protein
MISRSPHLDCTTAPPFLMINERLVNYNRYECSLPSTLYIFEENISRVHVIMKATHSSQ